MKLTYPRIVYHKDYKPSEGNVDHEKQANLSALVTSEEQHSGLPGGLADWGLMPKLNAQPELVLPVQEVEEEKPKAKKKKSE